MSTYAALLRGINVGGKNILPMKDLVRMFEVAGCEAVTSYIQSGNVVFSAPAPVMKKVGELVGTQIVRQFGFAAPMVVRSAAALRLVVDENPLLAAGASPDAVHVAFLARTPSAAQIATLDPNRSPPDTFAVVGAHVYLHCPNGVGGTKLTNAYFDGKLATISTARNWRTVLKLVEMTAGRTA
jgi:uncharacterized protein (DUF1697 family)